MGRMENGGLLEFVRGLLGSFSGRKDCSTNVDYLSICSSVIPGMDLDGNGFYSHAFSFICD